MSAVDLTQIGAGGRTLMLEAYDAGTEKNNEHAPYLVAWMGTDRDPENGVVTRHVGIRGDADAPPAWNCRGSVARVVIRPAP